MNLYLFYLMLLSLGLSMLVHFLVIDVSHKKGIFLDNIQKIQKAHQNPIPRIGGLGIFLSSMFIIFDKEIGTSIMLASIPAFIAGFIEDYSGKVAPLQRLLIMFLSPIFFITIIYPTLSNELVHISTFLLFLSALFIIIFVVAMTNGVNFIDGQNGLAAGSIIISLLTYITISIIIGDLNVVFVCSIIAIGTLSFLFFNYPKAKIFLGDGGAYFLGFITAITGVLLFTRNSDKISFLLIPTLLIYPLWEVVFSTLRKLFYEKISPLQSDKYHFHQLVFRTSTEQKAHYPALKILPLQLFISIIAIFCMHTHWLLAVLMLLYIVFYLFLYIYFRKADTLRRVMHFSKNK
jgi:UDP-GlcNAc:undecaprenyl-phosphate GlcNAc-1-phosphate transferase